MPSVQANTEVENDLSAENGLCDFFDARFHIFSANEYRWSPNNFGNQTLRLI